MENEHIRADGVEVTGYADMAQTYHVSSVPQTVVNETHVFVGAGPETMLLKHVQEAAADPKPAPAGGLIV